MEPETSAAGLAVLAVCVLCLGFWVPHRLRLRQQLAEARVDDRFSGGLRVLAVAAAGPVPAAVSPVGGSPPLLTSGTTVVAQVAGEERPMALGDDRGTSGGPAARAGSGATPTVSPAARASRTAQLERRAARARRRLLLTLVLVLATAAAWTVVGLGYVHWYAAAVPSALLALVLVLGRLAVVSARRADARWFEERRTAQREATQARALANGGPYAPRNRARVTGHAVRPSSAHTQMIPRVPAPSAPAAGSTARSRARAAAAASVPVGTVASPGPGAGREHQTAAAATGPEADGAEPERVIVTSSDGVVVEEPQTPVGGEPWDPVPVPLPTYVTKAEAPRRAVQSLRAAAAASATSAASRAAALPKPPVPSTTPAPSTTEPGPADGGAVAGRAPGSTTYSTAGDEPRPRTETLGLPLEQILARRRAAG